VKYNLVIKNKIESSNYILNYHTYKLENIIKMRNLLKYFLMIIVAIINSICKTISIYFLKKKIDFSIPS